MEINAKQFFSRYKIEPRVIEDLTKRIKFSTIKKGKYFINYGEKMNRIGILLSGLLVSRYETESGDEIVSKFYYPQGDIIVVDYQSFKKQSSSNEAIRASEDSYLMTLSYDNFNSLLNNHSSLKEMALSFLEESYLNALERIRSLQILSREQRIRNFMEAHPILMQKITATDKASYLGMHRNIFSKKLKSL